VRWVVVVEVDPAWFALKGALADQPCSAGVVVDDRSRPTHRVDRRSSQSRGIHPEIQLDSDTASHAVMPNSCETATDCRWWTSRPRTVRMSSEAGAEPEDETQPIEPGVPKALHDGDRVYVGAWSRLTVRVG
jgi:hypothetical protein